MLAGERGSTFGSRLGLILRFLTVGRKERLLLVQAAAQEGSAQPKDWEGSRQGMPGQGTRRREDQQSTRCSAPLSLSIACTNLNGAKRRVETLGTTSIPVRMVKTRTLSFPWGAPVSLLPCNEIIQ